MKKILPGGISEDVISASWQTFFYIYLLNIPYAYKEFYV